MASARHETLRPVPPPLEFGGSTVIWATWLYYVEGQTQADVAKILGVSRASIANYLAEARHRGLVKVSMESDLLNGISEGRALTQRFDLQGAMIVPTGADETTTPAALRRRLAQAAAQALQHRLFDGMTIGVAWGRTMNELAQALPERTLPETTVVQVSGSFFDESDTAPEACTSLIARRLGARCRNFHAPAVLGSRNTRDALLAEPVLQRHIERLRRCDVVLLGVGELHGGISWLEDELMPDDLLSEYIDRGACGILIGRLLNAEGREVDGPLAGRQVGMELADLGASPVRFVVAGGREKLAAIRATLTGGYATHLVTDDRTAQALLEEIP